MKYSELLDRAPAKADKNTRDFDLALLDELMALGSVDPSKFDGKVKQIMRRKSACKLWYTNIPSREWDGTGYRDCNYRCCPSSHKVRHMFCLVLDRQPDMVTVVDGFLTEL